MIKITIAAQTDAQEIQEVLYRTWLATYPNEEFRITMDDIEDKFKDRNTEENLARRRKQISNQSDTKATFVAKEADRIVGLCRMIRHKDKNQLIAIYVLPEYQGKGVGISLWHNAQKFFDGTKDTIVQVATYNKNAIEFYKKLGFQDTGKRLKDDKFKMKNGAIIPEMELVIKVKK